MVSQIEEPMRLFDEAAEASFEQGLNKRRFDELSHEQKCAVFKKITVLEASK